MMLLLVVVVAALGVAVVVVFRGSRVPSSTALRPAAIVVTGGPPVSDRPAQGFEGSGFVFTAGLFCKERA